MKEKNSGVLSNAFRNLKWALYGLKIKIFKPRKSKKDGGTSLSNTKAAVFLVLFLLFPTLQFLIFYVGVNFNSLLLSVQKFENNKFVYAGFENFITVFNNLFLNGILTNVLKNSVLQFVVTILFIPVHVTVSYVIFKEVPFGGFLKIMLFMPNMISSMLFVSTFKGIAGMQGLEPILGVYLLKDSELISFWSVLLFAQWMGFANGLIIYLSAMSSISTDILEYGQLEPLSTIKELWYVIIPSIFPTITTYLVLAIAGFFTNYGYFHTFFGIREGIEMTAPFETLGYYFLVRLVETGTESFYSYAAAAGIMFTLVAAPVTLLVKYLLEKYGPSED